MNWLFVFLGGGLGSLMRFGISKLTLSWFSYFPVSTLISNVFATVLLALIVNYLNWNKEHWMWYFLVIGFCGGFSTFSTFSMENVVLFEHGKLLLLIVNVSFSIVFSFLLFFFILGKN